MPPLFSQLFATAAAAQASFMGDPSASYLAFGSQAAPLTITAVPGPETDRILDTDTGQVLVRSCPITVTQAQVPTPGHGDQITLSTGVVWSVDVVESAAGGQWILQTVRASALEITPRGYRNRP